MDATTTYEIAKTSIRSAIAQVDAPLALGAALAALLSSLYTVANIVLLSVLAAATLLDLVTGALVAWKLGQFQSRKLWGGFVGKLLRFVLIILAALLDLAFRALAPEAAGAVVNLAPVLKFALSAGIFAEAISIVTNIQKSEGDLPLIRVVLRAVQRLNPGKKPGPGA